MSDAGGQEPCIFCDIVSGQLASSRVFEDDRAIAFLDVEPVTTGHVIVAPKVHAQGFGDVGEDLAAHLFRIAHRVAVALRRSGIPCEGINVFVADGVVAFQEVPHIHINVFPRVDGDGFVVGARWTKRTREELDVTARRLRKSFDVVRRRMVTR